MLEGLLPSMKSTDEDDYFMRPREKVNDDDSDDEDVKKKPEVVSEQVDHEATDHEQAGERVLTFMLM
jgi:hypothetical protein